VPRVSECDCFLSRKIQYAHEERHSCRMTIVIVSHGGLATV
jgi:hypothetical protein